MAFPNIDLHCDLLSYLQSAPNPDPFRKNDIGCSIPWLKEGGVRLQVMAIYTATGSGSSRLGLEQSQIFKSLLNEHQDQLSLANSLEALSEVMSDKKVGMVAAIENASGFCEAEDTLDDGFVKLERIIENTSGVLYLGLTHHLENRFGGGNTTQVGLKDDGRVLLEYISGRKIAIDLSHTSDPLAHDILEFIDKKNLDFPIIASHSNYRPIYDHNRNLPDELAKEIINRKGLIGVNLLRAFVDDNYPDTIYDHINHGLTLGGKESICFGADFFFTGSHPDRTREPFYHPEHENAGSYSLMIQNIEKRFSRETAEHISGKNVINFLNRIWV
ncbi:MAG: membrane dipeptidase [Reichenbachiella sp.]|uniref:dipeptidase n=1 Tax=Reichenbachiella sp. TaxID=2184521 RepID=UPI0032675E7C